MRWLDTRLDIAWIGLILTVVGGAISYSIDAIANLGFAVGATGLLLLLTASHLPLNKRELAIVAFGGMYLAVSIAGLFNPRFVTPLAVLQTSMYPLALVVLLVYGGRVLLRQQNSTGVFF